MNSTQLMRAAILAACLLGAAHPAFAQASATKVDLTDLLVALINQAFAAVGLFATYLINRHLRDKQLRDMLTNAVQNAVGVVQNKLVAGVRAADPTIDLRNEALAEGVKYIQENAKEALSRFDIKETQLAQKVQAKLGLVKLASEMPPIPAPVAQALPALSRG